MARLPWEGQAQAALRRVPLIVRPLVRRKVEERVLKQQGRRVSLNDFREAEERFRAVRAGRSEAELAPMLPQANRPGAETVVLEVCRNELSDCPNALIDTAAWHRRLGDWLQAEEVSERLRRKLADDSILYHHKLRLAVAGCPNGCSRPQIADVGLVGFVRPAFDPASCNLCGACAQACPDSGVDLDGEAARVDLARCQGCLACSQACPQGCVSLSQPGIRLLLGGKLGRRPHLAQPVAELVEPEAVIEQVKAVVDDYLAQARPGQRFADYWLLRNKEA